MDVISSMFSRGDQSPYPIVSFTSGEDIEEALRNPETLVIVERQSKNFYRLNVRDAMSNLAQVGELLKLAYAGSKGFPCSNEIVTILIDYQRLIKDSDLACSKFVNTSLAALKSHKLALDLTSKSKVPLALKQLVKCEVDAGNMIQLSQKLFALSENLCDEAKVAIQKATSDETISTEERNKVKLALAELAKKEAELSSRTKDLQTLVNEAREKEVRFLQEAKDADKKNLFFSILGSVGKVITNIVTSTIPIKINSQPESNPLSALTSAAHAMFSEKSKIEQELLAAEKDLAVKRIKLGGAKTEDDKLELSQEIAVLEITVRNKQQALQSQSNALEEAQKKLKVTSETAAHRAEEAGRNKLDIQREQLEANADLAGSVVKLKYLKQQGDDLSLAIASLEITIKTLGRVKTVFENTRTYWEGVKMHCQDLTKSIENCKEFADDPDLRGEFIEAIQTSGYNWLALGRVNWTASLAIADVNQGVDRIMDNLPTREQAAHMIEPLTNTMLRQIDQEKQTILELSKR